MNNLQAWTIVAWNIYWFIRWPLVCILWFTAGKVEGNNNNVLITLVAMVAILVATNLEVPR